MDANLVIFDNDASKAQFTPHLGVLLQHHGGELGYGNLLRIHIPFDVVNYIHTSEEAKNKNLVWGFKYEILDEEAIKIFFEHGGALPGGDSRIVLGEFDTDKYLLGSF